MPASAASAPKSSASRARMSRPIVVRGRPVPASPAPPASASFSPNAATARRSSAPVSKPWASVASAEAGEVPGISILAAKRTWARESASETSSSVTASSDSTIV